MNIYNSTQKFSAIYIILMHFYSIQLRDLSLHAHSGAVRYTFLVSSQTIIRKESLV